MARRSLFSALLLALCACSGGAVDLRDGLAACSADPAASHHVEVYVPAANVVSAPSLRVTSGGPHESFIIESSGSDLRVADNTAITGLIPLRRGDRVSLLGQLECDDDVIHWTHHDPRGRHQGGYIEADGKIYQ